MARQATRIERVVVAVLLFGAGLLVVACGKTDETPLGRAHGGGAAAGTTTGGAGAQGVGGSAIGAVGGSKPAGMGGLQAAGNAAGGASDGGAASVPECIDGARCECGELVGTLSCADATDTGDCSCPSAEICEAKVVSCFEPCGGEPLGVWVLEQTCLAGARTGDGCPGGFISAVATEADLRVRILEGEAPVALGHEGLDVTMRVPLSCLGIESVNRCQDAEFYASPLLYALNKPVACKASDCGECECSGRFGATASGSFIVGTPWKPGDNTLFFGAMEVPYCVDGDTLWVGGADINGTAKASYKFRRSSCVSTPTPCGQRVASNCGTDGSCYAGHCVETDSVLDGCDGLGWEQCSVTSGCEWGDTDKCFGDTAERCEFANCDATPGCSWGAPRAFCGGEPNRCSSYEDGECPGALGCARRSCVYGDGPDGDVACADLTASDCVRAVGCTWSGTSCSGVTHCWPQTDPGACSALGCFTPPSPWCLGEVTETCGDLTVDACSSLPGCRVEW
jgi:hypothetical protein